MLTGDVSEVSATTVAVSLDMNTSTAHRFLLSLEAAGALQMTRRGYFALGPGLAVFASLADEANPVVKLVSQEIASLSTQLNESVMACRRTSNDLICVAVSACDRPISVNIKIGKALPLLTSAQGKLWLAELAPEECNQQIDALNNIMTPKLSARRLRAIKQQVVEARASGFATNLGDTEPDIAAVSVPVRNAAGRMELTVSVFGILSRFDQKMIRRARKQLCQLSEDVSNRLGA